MNGLASYQPWLSSLIEHEAALTRLAPPASGWIFEGMRMSDIFGRWRSLTKQITLSRAVFLCLPLFGVLLFTLAGTCRVLAEDGLGDGPTAEDRKIARSVAANLRNHLLARPLDDEISRRSLKNFLNDLDPTKDYFTAQDIEEFTAYETKLDDQIAKGDLQFAHDVYKRLLARIDERILLVEEFLNTTHDYSVEESLVTELDLQQYARTPEETRDTWRRIIKLEFMGQTDILQREKIKKQSAAAPAGSEDANGATPDGGAAPDGRTIAPSPDGEAPGTPAPKGADEVASPASAATSFSPYSDTEVVEQARKRIRDRYGRFRRERKQTDHDELLELYLTSLTSAYDPHTEYWTPNSLETFEINMRLELDGIGAALALSDDGVYTEVREIIPGGAADRDGRLKTKDRIVGVGQGEEGAIVDVVGMKVNDVVPLVRGKRGSIVRLEILSIDSPEKKVFVLTRARIELADKAALGEVFEYGKRSDGTTYRVGVIDLPSFYRDMDGAEDGAANFRSSTRDVQAIIKGFREQHVDAIVMDLRSNPGGALSEAVELTGLFIDHGVVVKVTDSSGEQVHVDNDPGAVWKGPLVVLTSSFSASASEIFAGAIQDYRRGVVVGDPATHGKGTVQRVNPVGSPFEPLGALKLTMQKFYRPTGESTQSRGVLADLVLPSLTAHFKGSSEAEHEYALPFDTIAASDFTPVNLVDGELIRQLDDLSRARREHAEGFQRELRRIDRWEELQARKDATLNAAKYFADHRVKEELKLEEPEEDEEKSTNGPRKIKRNFYLDEALAITTDYVRLGTWPREPAAYD